MKVSSSFDLAFSVTSGTSLKTVVLSAVLFCVQIAKQQHLKQKMLLGNPGDECGAIVHFKKINPFKSVKNRSESGAEEAKTEIQGTKKLGKTMPFLF